MNQIGGMLGANNHDEMWEMAMPEEVAKVASALGGDTQLTNFAKEKNNPVNDSLLKTSREHIRTYQMGDPSEYTLKVVTNNVNEITINAKDPDFAKALRTDTFDTPYITVTTFFRVKALEGQIARFGTGLSVITFVKLFTRIIDNIADKCGKLGNDCVFLEDGILFFNKITNYLITQNYQPVGPLTMANEMMKQSYFNPNKIVSASATTSAEAAAKGKRRKSFKKKKGSKKRQHIKTNERN